MNYLLASLFAITVVGFGHWAVANLTLRIGRPQPGAWQTAYHAFWRLDIIRCNRRWWATVWACKPPSRDALIFPRVEYWYGPVRVVRKWEKVL